LFFNGFLLDPDGFPLKWGTKLSVGTNLIPLRSKWKETISNWPPSPRRETGHCENTTQMATERTSAPSGKLHGGYDVCRLNALRHGVLSAHTVLPWEDKAEYEALLNALVKEYAPHGPTEEHLVEEVAGVIWRKRRLRLAEAASYRRRFRRNASAFLRSTPNGADPGRTDHRLLHVVALADARRPS